MEPQLCLEIEEPSALSGTWRAVLSMAEETLGREVVESWLADAQPLSLEGGKLVVGVPNATARSWIERKYAGVLAGALGGVLGTETAVEVVVRKGNRPPVSERSAPAAPPAPARTPVPPMFAPIPLNEKYSFANFVVGQSNRFAQAAANAVVERPGREYNPLFIYGGVGLGKTHLLHAIGHALQARDTRTRIAYISGEMFTTHFVTSLREHKAEEFRRAYRSVDVWLVDDIQFIADKTGTKEEFFHTFNELYLTNRQIVLAADRPPRELRLMEDRLRSRLESGLMVEIGPPELETRMAILERRAQLEGAEVPPDILYQIAHAVSTNIRVLEAALIRVLALASLGRCGIEPALVARALGAFVQESQVACIGMVAVLRAVCEHFHVTEQELTGPRRDRQISLARQVAMYLMREISGKSLVEIGRFFGGKAHSTVLYSCSKLEKEMQTDAALSSTVLGIRARLAGS